MSIHARRIALRLIDLDVSVIWTNHTTMEGRARTSSKNGDVISQNNMRSINNEQRSGDSDSEASRHRANSRNLDSHFGTDSVNSLTNLQKKKKKKKGSQPRINRSSSSSSNNNNKERNYISRRSRSFICNDVCFENFLRTSHTRVDMMRTILNHNKKRIVTHA
jgi:hypothetical protein